MPSVEPHVDSHYASVGGDTPMFAPLRGTANADVCVIGGGLAGLTAARELAHRGVDVRLLEGRRIAWGASGRNGGFVSDGFAADWETILNRVDLDHARKLHALASEGAEYVRRTIAEAGREDIIQGHEGLSLRRTGTVTDAEEHAAAAAARFGRDRTVVSGDALRALVDSERYTAGTVNPNAFHIDPLAYARCLAALVHSAGAVLHEGTMVKGLTRDGESWRVTTADGDVLCRHVVLATSAYGTPFAPLRRAIVPVSTYVMVSKPAEHLLAKAIRFRGTISDTRRAGDYYRLVGSGAETRLIWGGRITTKRAQPKALGKKLLGDVLSVYPQLGGLEVERAWMGWMGYARHAMPLIGQFWSKHENLWSATAFGGHGLNTTAMAGLLTARAIAEGDKAHRLFRPWRPTWAGGPVGTIAVQATYAAMQMNDWREERIDRSRAT